MRRLFVSHGQNFQISLLQLQPPQAPEFGQLQFNVLLLRREHSSAGSATPRAPAQEGERRKGRGEWCGWLARKSRAAR
ncbi:hypothetical protein DM860_000516 [Cuscuta australis]|uniref:Uncharacterized protein n=1 Tax=Cuscuta australis TaxID=267555 RepID=A0A328CWN1_9ASTE|nr:hypothetical protein DM860_000516 [Cuscuta australis]